MTGPAQDNDGAKRYMAEEMAKARKPKPLTNVQLVTQIMNVSKFGAMSQIFIIDAILKQAEAVARMPLEDLKAAMANNGMVSAQAWHGVATEIADKMKAQGY